MAMAAAGACAGLALAAAAAAPSAARRSVGVKRVALPCAFLSSEVRAATSSIAFSEGRSVLRIVSRPVERRRKGGFEVRGLFGLGVPELAVIAGVAALVFGPKQLPAIGKNLGKTVKSFQQAAKEFESEISKAKDSQSESQKNSAAIEETPKEETITSTPIATSTNTEKDSS